MNRILAILLTLFALGLTRHLAFDDDEFQHAHMSVMIGRGQVPHRDFFEHHLPLYHALHAPWMAGASGPEALLRLRAFSALCLGATLALGAGILRRRLGAVPPAILLWTGLCPIFLIKMIEARPESLALALFMASLWCLSLDRPRPARAGLAGAAMVLCSQKFLFPAAGLFLVAWMEGGPKSALRLLAGALPPPLLYLGVLVATNSLAPAWEHLVVMNAAWRESFSPWMYGGLLWRTSGGLCVVAALGLSGLRASPTARAAAVLAGAALLGVFIVPIPFRQTWMMVIPGLFLAAGAGWTRIEHLLAHTPHRRAALAALALLALLPALAELERETRELAHDDLAAMRQIAERVEGPVFDGRGLVFWRDHVGFYPWIHRGLMTMLDPDTYATHTRTALRDAGLPPFHRDYRAELFPEALRTFLHDHYLETDLPGLWQPGFIPDRGRLAGGGLRIDLPSAGLWRFTWTGGTLFVNEQPLDPGAEMRLPAGPLRLSAKGFIRNARVIRVGGPQ